MGFGNNISSGFGLGIRITNDITLPGILSWLHICIFICMLIIYGMLFAIVSGLSSSNAMQWLFWVVVDNSLLRFHCCTLFLYSNTILFLYYCSSII